MFKRSAISSAIALSVALYSQTLYAEEENSAEEKVTEVIEVTGIRSTLTKAIGLKKENMQIVDSIIAEDIGKFPDNNVVEALQRVTGVQVSGRGGGEVSGVTIRGLGDISTTVNGRKIFTGTGRSVALQDIPASLLNKVDVFKTRSADLIVGGLAGQIDIATHRPFNFKDQKFVVAARGIYSDATEQVDPNMSFLASDRWEVDGAGEFGALINLSYAEYNYRDQNVWIGSSDPYRADDYSRINSDYITRGVPLDTSPGSTIDIDGVPTEYVLIRDAMGMTDYTGYRERPAANISLQWAPNKESEYLFEAFYNGYRNEDFNSLMFIFVNNNQHFRNPELYENSNVVQKTFINNVNMFSSGDGSIGQTDSYVYSLGGKWFLDDLLLKSEVVYQQSEYTRDYMYMQTNATKDRLAVDFNHELSGDPLIAFLDDESTANLDESDLTNPADWSAGSIFDGENTDDGDSFTWSLDGVYDVGYGIFENLTFGLRYDQRNAITRSKDQSGTLCSDNGNTCNLANLGGLISVSEEGFFDGNAYLPSNWLSADGKFIADNQAYVRGLYGLPLDGGDFIDARTFDITETTQSAYVQSDYVIEFGDQILDGQVGVRVVNTETDLLFNEVTPVSQNTSNTVVLPNFMARYFLTDDLMVRFSYGQTISMPSFGDLNPTMSLTPPAEFTNATFGFAGSGNPDLKPVESTNYDLSLEYYFSESSTIYGVLFKRDVEGFVFTSSKNIEITDDPREEYNAKYVLTQPSNAGKGTLNGLELGFQYFPDDVAEWLNGFGVIASYTYIDAETQDPIFSADTEAGSGELIGYETKPLVGVSENSYSVVLAYEKDKFSTRLSYVYRDGWLTGYNFCCSMPTGTYADAESDLNFSASYDISDELVVTFDATNLTGEIFHGAYTDFTLFNSGSSMFSRTYALGLRYSF